MNQVLDLSPRLTLLPILHGSADFAQEVRRRLRRNAFDCLAVPLPPSFAEPLERGVAQLPQISLVLQREVSLEAGYNYAPVDPCQGVIAAVREAMDRGVERAYIDLEVEVFEEQSLALPDPYALKAVQLEKLLAVLLPYLPAPEADSQRQERIRRMAFQLHCLELEYRQVVGVCSVADWPWIRQAYMSRMAYAEHRHAAGMPELKRVEENSLYFVLGELPYITYLYEHHRAELLADETLTIDGVKALLLEARDAWVAEQEFDDYRLTPQLLSLLLRYVRNLTLMDHRLTPDLYNLALAAKQVAGDDFALTLIEVACDYPPQRLPSILDDIDIGIGKVLDADGEVRVCKNRLQGALRCWRRLPLKPNPPPLKQRQWGLQWDPFGQCSYPPEDQRIESFQQHVREQARLLVGETEARTEKFTASLKDGLDIRETLRNWHTGQIYVRQLPPSRGNIEVVVLLFECPADAARYSWRSTWYAEHEEESTLSFFATPFMESMIGPGIGQAVYGGCFFLYPPRPIPDIWQDPRLDFARSLEERLLAGALLNSQDRRVVLVAPCTPLPAWRRLARRCGRQLVYMPLRRFSAATVDRLRRFHVLNGKQVRSYAARFIRQMR